MKNEVSGTYKQYLSQRGGAVLIPVPESYFEKGLFIKVNKTVPCVLVPLQDVTREKIISLENFVKNNVESERYKPLWSGNALFVNISKWCKYEQINPDGSTTPIMNGTVLGAGHYSMEITASHVYVGPHKGGETYSLSLHVDRILYRKSEDIMDLIEALGQHKEDKNVCANYSATAENIPKRKASRGRAKLNAD